MMAIVLLALLVPFLSPLVVPAPWPVLPQNPMAERGTVYDRLDDNTELPDGTAPHHPKSQPSGRSTLGPPDHVAATVGVGVDDDHGQTLRSYRGRAPPLAA